MRFRAPSDPALALVKQLTSGLAVPQPWDMTAFLAQVTTVVGKDIRLMPLSGSAAAGMPCGLALERVDDIVIAYDANSSGYHADHIVLHEIGHLLLRHAGVAPDAGQRATIGMLLPGIDPDTALQVLQRSNYDDASERQAELFASLVMSAARTTPTGSALRRTLFLD
jgi:Zn-dependent peptidase ImmA (M78 family)